MKDFGSLVVRGIVGAVSIVTTAVISVLVQRYLNSTGTPVAPRPPVLAPPAAVAPAGNETDLDEGKAPSDRPVVQLEPSEPTVSSGQEDDRPNAAERSRALQEFWQKLNR